MKFQIFVRLFLGLSLYSSSANSFELNNYQLPENTVFTLNRVNYKAKKTLIYQTQPQSGTCQLFKDQPLNVHYIVGGKTGFNRIEMSKKSREYFGAENINLSKDSSQVQFDFKALRMFDVIPEAQRKIQVKMVNEGEHCKAYAFVHFNRETYQLLNIQTRMKKTFGFPTGVRWVKMHVVDEKGAEQTMCVAGDC